jgi:hypothetical protein
MIAQRRAATQRRNQKHCHRRAANQTLHIHHAPVRAAGIARPAPYPISALSLKPPRRLWQWRLACPALIAAEWKE